MASCADIKIQQIIKEKRHEYGWSREELGEKLGVSSSYIYRLERGDRKNPSTKVLMGLCELFNLSPNEITDTYNENSSMLLNNQQIEEYEEMKNFILSIDIKRLQKIQNLLTRDEV